ncbi:packaged DNA stabilization protein [Albimonas pacifica]|uniref:Phage stabilisation protein n=1 Tax=Albimonas pacifica TaxID=1114924 RepID=A0A1I3LHW6_9RHOB|nr:packaged DNA stabilization protein [Albimonas pacifica]SFI84348.1 Phage stabilisation protein [Albimonas pacifica]
MPLLAFARQSAGTEFAEYSGERLLNFFAEPFPDAGTGRLILAPSPGLTAFANLSTGPVRDIYVQAGIAYAASDGSLYRIRSGGAVTNLGAIVDDPTTTITGNGFDVAVAAGGNYYVYNIADETLAEVAPGVFNRTESVTRLDNYIILSERGGQRFAITALADASTIDALDFASAESAPDDVVRVHADHSELWFFGTETVEVFGNTGNADFPFQRLSGGVIERGCAFGGSVASDDNSVFWVGDDRLCYRAQGYTPSVISTPPVSRALQETEGDIYGFTFTWRGHKSYCLRFSDRPAWIYDIATNLWHERATGTEAPRWMALCAARFGSETLIGGRDGTVYTLGGVTDGGTAMLREAISLPLENGGDRFSLHELELSFKTGATDFDDATAVLQISKDGREWGLERERPLGSIGNYLKRVRWHGLGNARQFRARVRITDPIDVAIYGAKVRAG